MEEEQAPSPVPSAVRAALAGILAEPPVRPWGGLPADWADALRRSFGPREVSDLVRVLNRPAESCDLRVNTARLAREEARAILAGEGVPVTPTRHAPDGLRLEAGRDVRRHRLYREGLLEIQDESSQLVALLALPPQGGTVLDFCAGAGGKTLALAAALRGHGRIDAYEIDSLRRAELRRRLARAGVRPGVVHVLASSPAGGELYDVVLVDAPCSGSGTLRRAPHLLWRPLDLAAEAQRQRAILARAAGFVRPGGRLVYATCSVFDEENRAVAASLTVDDGHWRPGDPRERLEEAGVKDAAALVAGGVLRLLPHRHGTDGMEACLWVRTGA
jgi:16S rRNA (cytosine967-C5)-methyltransferase